jgi:hypothetical protein
LLFDSSIPNSINKENKRPRLDDEGEFLKFKLRGNILYLFFYFVNSVPISRKEFEQLSTAVYEIHTMLSRANVQRFPATAGEFHNKVVAKAFEGKTVPCLEQSDVMALNTVLSTIQLSTSLVSAVTKFKKKIIYFILFFVNRSLNWRSSLKERPPLDASSRSASRD